MSDQGELAGRRSTPSNDTNDLDPADRPTGQIPQVAQPDIHDKSADADADAGAPTWEPAESMSFSADRRPDAADEPGISDQPSWAGRQEPSAEDQVSWVTEADQELPRRRPRPEAPMPDLWGDATEPEAPAAPEPADRDFAPPAQDERESPAQDEYAPPVRAEYEPPVRNGYAPPVRAEYEPPVRDGYAPPVRDGYARPAPPQAPEAPGAPGRVQQPGWEGSLFDDGGMDSGPGDPRYAPVDMSGPGTPPKPGTPSSGNLRLPDWMKESTDPDDAAATGSRSSDRGSSDRGLGDDEGGASRTALYAGIGLLVVALLAAGGIFLLRSGGSDADSPTSGQGATKSAGPEPRQVAASLPPDRQLRRFPGPPTRAAGLIKDVHAGIAYPRFGLPWVLPTKKNKLAQRGWSGQQIVVTEQSVGQIWYGQLLSGTLSVSEGGAYRGAGTEREAAVAVNKSILERSYAFQHTTSPFASQALDVDGRKGWLVASALRYRRPGVKATGELVVVAVIDTGRKTPAVLFLAVPNTHQKLWPDVNHLLANLKVLP